MGHPFLGQLTKRISFEKDKHAGLCAAIREK
jgi:hypothetical protein